MQSVCDHSPTPVLMVGDGRGSGTAIHPPSNHATRGVYLRTDILHWLRALWPSATEEQRATLIAIGRLAGLEPGEWVPPE